MAADQPDGRPDLRDVPILEAGDDDLAIAVSEDFGGWGMQARFDDLEGISLA